MDSLGNSGYANSTKSQEGYLTFPPTNTTQGPAGMSANASVSSSYSEYLQPPEPTRPPMDQMMETSTGSFRGWIRSINDFHQVNDQYLHIHDRPRGNCSDFPLDANEQLQLIKALFEAAQDCSQIYEPENSQSAKRIRQNSYTDVEFELVLWPLLMSTRDAQVGECKIPNYFSSGDPPYNAYGSFMERFDAVRNALKSSKDVVVSLFKDATYKHRLAWRPKTELSQKATNRKLNGNRDVQNVIGARIAKENGIKANENGELVDRNGQKYGSVKKRSASFEEKVSKPKAPRRSAKRTKLDSKATVQNDAEEVAEASTISKGFGINHQEVIDLGIQSELDQPVLSGSPAQGFPPLPTTYAPNSIVGTPDSTLFGSTSSFHDQSSGPFMGTGLLGSTNDSYDFYQTPTSGNSGSVAGSSAEYVTPQMLNSLDGFNQLQGTGSSFVSGLTTTTTSFSELSQPPIQPSYGLFDLIPHTQATESYQAYDGTGYDYSGFEATGDHWGFGGQ
ncbi:hypothetical protein F4776DRAFT_670480 [Hypoxylon sp. NC0597]|nr:hypothetical protein F4776DRAFT_670480 [Hypoxylon sp. NC0597]